MKEDMKEEYRLPDGLDQVAEDALLAAVLAEKGPECLAPEPRRWSPRRWIWAAVPAVALASLAAVLLISRPRPLPSEVEDAYARFGEAFSYFSQAIDEGMNSLSTPFQETIIIQEK